MFESYPRSQSFQGVSTTRAGPLTILERLGATFGATASIQSTPDASQSDPLGAAREGAGAILPVPRMMLKHSGRVHGIAPALPNCVRPQVADHLPNSSCSAPERDCVAVNEEG